MILNDPGTFWCVKVYTPAYWGPPDTNYVPSDIGYQCDLSQNFDITFTINQYKGTDIYLGMAVYNYTTSSYP